MGQAEDWYHHAFFHLTSYPGVIQAEMNRRGGPPFLHIAFAAHLFAEIEMCKSLVIKALQTLDNSSDGVAELVSLTKAKLAETAHLATTEAIQMHGGIGMTDDFDIGFFLKRCRILESLFGDQYFHLDRFARERGY